MSEPNGPQDKAIEPCPKCGWIKFNPDCPECRETQEQCLLLGGRIEGFDV